MLISAKTPKEVTLKLAAECKQCGHCCSYGSGSLTAEDEKRIARSLKISREELKKNYLEEIEKFNTTRHRPKLIRENGLPYGKCIFLKNNKCSIQSVKPLQCKTSNCNIQGPELQKWFDLNYFVNKKDPESIRQYATYLAFNDPLPGASLLDLVPDKAELQKILSYEKVK